MNKNKKNDNKFISKEIKKTSYMNEDYKKAISFIIVLIIILGLIALLFFLNGKYVTKDEFQNTTTTTTAPSYDETVITVDKMFKMSDSEYMVMLYDKTVKESSVLYDGLVNSYSGEVNLYSVDLSKKMNSKYYDTKGKENTKPTKASEVMITKPTLIVIKKGKVTSYITNTDDIVKKLAQKAEN